MSLKKVKQTILEKLTWSNIDLPKIGQEIIIDRPVFAAYLPELIWETDINTGTVLPQVNGENMSWFVVRDQSILQWISSMTKSLIVYFQDSPCIIAEPKHLNEKEIVLIAKHVADTEKLELIKDNSDTDDITAIKASELWEYGLDFDLYYDGTARNKHYATFESNSAKDMIPKIRWLYNALPEGNGFQNWGLLVTNNAAQGYFIYNYYNEEGFEESSRTFSIKFVFSKIAEDLEWWTIAEKQDELEKQFENFEYLLDTIQDFLS